MKVLFSTFVRPILEYAAPVWNPYNIGDIESIESVQKNATKLVPSLRSRHYRDRLQIIDLCTLEERWFRGDLIQYYKVHRGLNKLDWLNPNGRIASAHATGPASNTRGNSYRLALPLIRNCARRDNFLSNRIVPTWNDLSDKIINAKNINVFKNKLDFYLKDNKRNLLQQGIDRCPRFASAEWHLM